MSPKGSLITGVYCGVNLSFLLDTLPLIMWALPLFCIWQKLEACNNPLYLSYLIAYLQIHAENSSDKENPEPQQIHAS